MLVATKEVNKDIATEEFKPVFLHTNKDYYKAYIGLYDKSINDLNSLISESERITKRKLTDKEKKAISKTGIQFIITEVKDSFQFVDAAEDFNLRALGVNFKDIEKLSFTYKNIRCKYQYVLNNNGKFERYHKEVDKINNDSDVYTSTPKQNARLIFVKQLVKVLKDGLKSETISHYDLIEIVYIINGLVLHVNDDSKGQHPAVNTSVIHSMAG